MKEQWMRRSTYGGVWHRVEDAERLIPLCRTVLRGGAADDYEFSDEVPYTRHVSYVCLRCYRIERGVDPMPVLVREDSELRQFVGILTSRVDALTSEVAALKKRRGRK